MNKDSYLKIAIGWDVGGWSGKNHGLCVLAVGQEQVEVLLAPTQMKVQDLLPAFQHYLGFSYQEIVLAIDAPLGFPSAFAELLNNEQADFTHILNKPPKTNAMAWRACDLHIKKLFKSPLSATFSFLTSNTTLAISLLRSLKHAYPNLCVLPFDGLKKTALSAIEVYPALMKTKAGEEEAKFIKPYMNMIQQLGFDSLDGAAYYQTEGGNKSDSFDALICALYGLSFLGNSDLPSLELEIPSSHLAMAQKEGWIYYPKV